MPPERPDEPVDLDALQKALHRQDWQDFGWWLAWQTLRIGFGLFVLYVLVRFVKWAWEG